LRSRFGGRNDVQVAHDLPLDRDDVVTIMGALFDIRAGVTDVIRLFEEDDEEEAPEEDDT
jgi:hypothetical protein